MEQALQNATYSGISEAAEIIRMNPNYLPYSKGKPEDQKNIPVEKKTFRNGKQSIQITVEVRGERGKIYFYDKDKKKIAEPRDGIYLMSRASINKDILGEKIYRRAYAYILDGDTTINFMELPTLDGFEIKKST